MNGRHRKLILPGHGHVGHILQLYDFIFMINSTVLLVSICQRSIAKMKTSNLKQNLQFSILNLQFNRVENNGFEPLTPCLQSRCSSQLS